MLRSKYGMLEIFRAAYGRVEAVLLMRQLNRKFRTMSRDPYLENFTDYQGVMFHEVRRSSDLEHLHKMIKYANLIKGDNCLQIDFYWNF